MVTDGYFTFKPKEAQPEPRDTCSFKPQVKGVSVSPEKEDQSTLEKRSLQCFRGKGKRTLSMT